MAELNETMKRLTLPSRIVRLAVNSKGYPIPYFVADNNGSRDDLRVTDENRRVMAVRKGLCWVCGETLGQFKYFVIGPMCVINRVTSEPPCHRDCAIFAAIACPFLTKPRMKRNTENLPESHNAPGIALERNPGATAIWITKSFKLMRVDKSFLIRLDNPTEVLWYSQGRVATRDEVLASINSGYPLLLDVAKKEGPGAIEELGRYRERAMKYLP